MGKSKNGIRPRRRESTSIYKLLTPRPANASNRKLRLFLCGWYRHFYWKKATDPRTRRAVEVAELYADSLVTKKEVEAAHRAARAAYAELSNSRTFDVLENAFMTTHGLPLQAAKGIALAPKPTTVGKLPRALLREVLGEPSGLPPLEPRWLAWDGGTVPKVARAIYDVRDLTSEKVEVQAEHLAKFFGHFPCRVRLAYFSTCYSAEPARHLARQGAVDVAIGFPGKIADDLAIGLVESFYQLIGDGQTVKNALGMAAPLRLTKITDNLHPILATAPGIAAETYRLTEPRPGCSPAAGNGGSYWPPRRYCRCSTH